MYRSQEEKVRARLEHEKRTYEAQIEAEAEKKRKVVPRLTQTCLDHCMQLLLSREKAIKLSDHKVEKANKEFIEDMKAQARAEIEVSCFRAMHE